ncbi:DUF1656 domain-containing protein [Photobacterium damselae]|uniref:DUF1656 domain-containing protein n=1 Tax=Photobacterium damselae TaxID=38293 RepID=UPI001593AF7D|nr:DUF1656 domain-containing protein [Photobacterium damselae]MCG3825983.1 DUF1656 domain-containing protein [Photobacterium damselae]NVH46128.1 DUF1656 domain-containing protein [Photobacterium damselae subsp. damselae]
MLNLIPKEIAIGEIYFPPLLISGFIAVICTSITVRIFNTIKWYKYVSNPPLVELSIAIIYIVLISTFIFPS